MKRRLNKVRVEAYDFTVTVHSEVPIDAAEAVEAVQVFLRMTTKAKLKGLRGKAVEINWNDLAR